MRGKARLFEYADGGKVWCRNGKLHRDDGPAIVWANGSKYWYLNGELHCEHGPAIEEADGYKAWCRDGERHREDGPAIECANGNKFWYLNGEELTEEQFNARMSKPLSTLPKYHGMWRKKSKGRWHYQPIPGFRTVCGLELTGALDGHLGAGVPFVNVCKTCDRLVSLRGFARPTPEVRPVKLGILQRMPRDSAAQQALGGVAVAAGIAIGMGLTNGPWHGPALGCLGLVLYLVVRGKVNR